MGIFGRGFGGTLAKAFRTLKRRVRGILKTKQKRRSRSLESSKDSVLAGPPKLLSQNSNPSFLSSLGEFSSIQLSPHTQRAYRRDLEDFLGFLKRMGMGSDWAAEWNSVLVVAYRSHLIDERKLARSSVTRRLAVVKSFGRWCVAKRYLSENPAELVKSFPQTQESKTGYLDNQEIQSLLMTPSVQNEERISRALATAVVEGLLMLGLRRSELCRIRLSDFEYLDGNWLVRIHGKGDRDRLLPLIPRLMETWSQWIRRAFEDAPVESLARAPTDWTHWLRARQDLYLFFSTRAKNSGVPLSTSEVAHIVRKRARISGLSKRVSPHMLRATAITHALDQGATHRGVQQMAGWTSPLMITRYDKRRKDPKYSGVWKLHYGQYVADPIKKPNDDVDAGSQIQAVAVSP
jgi:integrase/recombinase XerC